MLLREEPDIFDSLWTMSSPERLLEATSEIDATNEVETKGLEAISDIDEILRGEK